MNRQQPLSPFNTAKQSVKIIQQFSVLSLLLALSIMAMAPACSRAMQNPPPPQQQPQLTSGPKIVDYKTFHSEKLGRDVKYALQLPPSYETSKKKYPVMIFLLGLFENISHWEDRGGSVAADKLRADEKIGEMIIVTVAAENGMYTDSLDGKNLWQQALSVDLIKHIDTTYRTMPGPAHRAIGGISLGGYGALKMAYRHPELFSVVIAHCAAILPDFPPKPSQPNPRSFYGLFTAVFGEPYDKEMWDNNDPVVLAKRNAAQIKKTGLKIYFDCGTEDRFGFFNGAKTLDATLTSAQITHEYHLFPGNHGWPYTIGVMDHSFPFAWQTIK